MINQRRNCLWSVLKCRLIIHTSAITKLVNYNWYSRNYQRRYCYNGWCKGIDKISWSLTAYIVPFHAEYYCNCNTVDTVIRGKSTHRRSRPRWNIETEVNWNKSLGFNRFVLNRRFNTSKIKENAAFAAMITRYLVRDQTRTVVFSERAWSSKRKSSSRSYLALCSHGKSEPYDFLLSDTKRRKISR